MILLSNQMYLQFVVLDAGGTIGSSNIVGDLSALYHTHAHTLMSTYSAECMRQYLSDCVEFISDLHTISKVKVNVEIKTSVTCIPSLM